MPEALTVTVVGAGGKMGMRVSANLDRAPYETLYAETSPAARERVTAAGRTLTDTTDAVPRSDVVILAVPDVLLGEISAGIVPAARPGAIILTLDPAAAYAGVLARRDDLHLAVAHPCHPSVFLERTSAAEWADTFGGDAAPQDVVAAIESGGDRGARARRGSRAGDVRAGARRALGDGRAARLPRADARRDHHVHDQRAAQGGAARDRHHGGRPRGRRQGDAARPHPGGADELAARRRTRSPRPA